MADSIESTPQSEISNLLVIDGDAIPWMIGWHHKDHREVSVVQDALDKWFGEFLLLTQASKYLGIIAPDEGRCFRYDVYKVRPYKGSRPPKDEWIEFWEPVIRQHLQERWGFVQAPSHLETDDVVAAVAQVLSIGEVGQDIIPVICSPDKDLKQIPGFHLNYMKADENGHLKQEEISTQHATFNYYKQLMMGDATDCIMGLPGMGEKKAEKFLNERDSMMWRNEVILAYQKHFGSYYGNIIFAETEAAVKMVTLQHPMWGELEFGFDVTGYLDKIQTVNNEQIQYEGIFGSYQQV